MIRGDEMHKRYTRKDVIKSSFFTMFLLLITLLLGYIILKTDTLSPRAELLSTSNISFNNSNATDMLKISNLKKMSEDKGTSNHNKSTTNIKISGNKDYECKIVLYHVGNIVGEEYVHYELSNSNVLRTGNLSTASLNNDGGRIIYEGKIEENKNFELKMWVDKNYEGNVKNVSYEIKIKAK